MENNDNDLKEQIRRAEELAHRLGEPIVTAVQGDSSANFKEYKDFDPRKYNDDLIYVIVHINYDENSGKYMSYYFTVCSPSIENVYDVMRNDLRCTQNLNDPTFWKSTVKDDLYYKIINAGANDSNSSNIILIPPKDCWNETFFQKYKDFDPSKRFVPEKDQLYWAINWGWDKEPTTYCKFWTGTCDDYQNLYLGNCFRHRRAAEKLKYQYCEQLIGKNLPITRLCCLQAIKVNFTMQSVDLYLDPNGYKHLDDLPLQIDDGDMVLVVQTFNNQAFESVVRLYTLSKDERFGEDVELRLNNKLAELGLSRFDLFCPIAPTFRDKIVPMLKPVDGVDGYSLCKL